MISFDEAMQVLWEARSRIRARQIARWLKDAREMRSVEFTPEKEEAWLATQLEADISLRLRLGLAE